MKLPKAFHLYHVEPSVVIFGIPLVNEGNTKNDYTRVYMAVGERP